MSKVDNHNENLYIEQTSPFHHSSLKTVQSKELWYLKRVIKISSTVRHIILECSVCKKRMRSDSLKRHELKKHKNFNFQVTTIVKANVKNSGIPSYQDLESEFV